MKLSKTALMTFVLLFCCVMDGYSDRIYTWVDSKGVTHMTQEPPLQTAKSIDVLDYSAKPGPPPPQPAARAGSIQQQENSIQGGGQAGSGSSTGIASGDAEDNIEYDYDGDPYRRALRMYQRRVERLDNNEPIREGERPERVQPRPRGR